MLHLEPLDANVQGQIAQIAREHSGGHAVLRDLWYSHKQEHGSALEASLQDTDAQLKAEIEKLSAERSDHKAIGCSPLWRWMEVSRAS